MLSSQMHLVSPPTPIGSSRVPVLMYHRIGLAGGANERRYCVSPGRFAKHMHTLAQRGMWACSIEDFVAWLEGSKTMAPGAFLLTFDDGFLGVFEHAFPIVRELRWAATVFLVSGLIGGKNVWQRAESRGRTFPLLGLDQINAMRQGGIAFHSHTRTHPDLTRLGDDALVDEIAGSKQELERLLNVPVRYLAYPYGRFDERAPTAARKAGYRAAFSVQSGFNHPHGDPYCIRRLDVFGTDTPNQLLRKVNLGTNDGSWSRSVSYYVDRICIRMRNRMRPE